MVKHLFYAAWNTSPCRTSARQGGERSGPCRDVLVTELCEVKGDVTIPELKEQLFVAHSPSDISARRQVQDSGKKKKGTNLTRRWTEPFRHRQRKVVGTNCSTAHQWKRVQHRASCGFRQKDDLCSETKPQ